ncbi:MAG: PhoX family phosphatase [Pseudomonadota bacterium]
MTLKRSDYVEFDDSENIPSNASGNRPFQDVLKSATSRRAVLQGTLAGAATGFLAPEAMAQSGDRFRRRPPRGRELVGFEELSIEAATVGDQKMPVIAEEYEYQVLIPWGTPIEPGATEEYTGDPATRPTPQQALKQIGIGHDGMFFYPMDDDCRILKNIDLFGRRANRRGMLCINHEFGINPHVLGKVAPESIDDVRLSQHVHGVSVVALEKRRSRWEVIASPNSRRINVNTRVTFSGPAAGSALLENPAGNAPLGTVNNCGSGTTPWGTYLTCEENFNGYFGDSRVEGPIAASNDDVAPRPTETEADARYGFSARGFSYGWYAFDKRFDLADPDFVNERNRFGWVVEIDPGDASQTPVKRTALGRFKHEAIAIKETPGGRIAAYMGDDQRFDYCYKYVSNRSWRRAVGNGESPLDDGVLYVARFDEDFTGEWLELSMNVPALAERFEDMADLLVNTRIAADIVGATPMDRPEWTTIGQNGAVFWTLTNNSQRTEADAANPEAPNSDGHIIRTLDAEDGLGTTFSWEIYILASSTRETPGVFTDPDAAYADPFGRLFIGTDGGQPDGLQDQVVVFDTTAEPPTPKRLLVGVQSDELTGWAFTPDFRTAFVNIQHPGNGDPSRTNFPASPDNFTVPRDATLVITRRDGGVVGS